MTNRVNILRERLRLSQAQLAERLRVNQSTVSRLERNEIDLEGPILTAVEFLEQSLPAQDSEATA